MQFLVLNERNTAQFQPEQFTHDVVAPEVARVKELYGSGFIRQIWHREDIPGGCLLVEADNEETARSLLATLPLVEAGMVQVATVVPLKPFGGFTA